MSSIASLLGLPLAEVFLTYVGVIAALVGAALLRYLPHRPSAGWNRHPGGLAGVCRGDGLCWDPRRSDPDAARHRSVARAHRRLRFFWCWAALPSAATSRVPFPSP